MLSKTCEINNAQTYHYKNAKKTAFVIAIQHISFELDLLNAVNVFFFYRFYVSFFQLQRHCFNFRLKAKLAEKFHVRY